MYSIYFETEQESSITEILWHVPNNDTLPIPAHFK